MIELVWVRHGQPEWEPDGRAVNNPHLTELGKQQAEQAAQFLRGQRFDGFYVSPLIRARETAAPIAAALNSEPEILPWLEEIRLPSMDGLPVAQVQHFFDQVKQRELAEWWEALPGGESFRHFNERIRAGLLGLLGERAQVRHLDRGPYSVWELPEDGKRFLMVCHLGTTSVALANLLGRACSMGLGALRPGLGRNGHYPLGAAGGQSHLGSQRV